MDLWRSGWLEARTGSNVGTWRDVLDTNGMKIKRDNFMPFVRDTLLPVSYARREGELSLSIGGSSKQLYCLYE